MDFDKYQEYIQERWDGMVSLLEEKKLNDYALGRAMIKFSKSKNPIAKNMRDRGMKQAKKYMKKQHDKNLAKMELIAEYIAGQLLTEVEKHGSKISNGEVTTNKNETSTVIKAKITPKIDGDDFTNKLSDYLIRCRDRGDIEGYDFGFYDDGRFSCTLKIKK